MAAPQAISPPRPLAGAVRWAEAGVVDLANLDPEELTESGILELLGALATLKAAASGAQTRLTAAYDSRVRDRERDAGVPASRRGRGVAAAVGAARRESPWQGARRVTMAQTMTQLPRTSEALSWGRISEWKAQIVASEASPLNRQQRTALDTGLAERLETLPEKMVQAEGRKIAYSLDPQTWIKRHRTAVNDRHVSVRPIDDGVVRLSAVLDIVSGIACLASLQKAADRILASGNDPATWPPTSTSPGPTPPAPNPPEPSPADPGPADPGLEVLNPVPTRSQLMADELVARITGRTVADPADIEVNLIITDTALFGEPPSAVTPEAPQDASVPLPPNDSRLADSRLADSRLADLVTARVAATTATLVAEGVDPIPIPAGTAKDLLLSQSATVFIRRLFGAPGHLIAMESTSRTFSGLLRKFIILRDRHCQTPHCGAPIRHIDHIIPHHHGGPTTAHNAQGLCAACNLAKAATTEVAPTKAVIDMTCHPRDKAG